MRQGSKGAMLVAAALAVGLALWLLRDASDETAPSTETAASDAASFDPLALPADAARDASSRLAASESVVEPIAVEPPSPGEPLRVSGRVVDSAHRPVPGALVTHWPSRAWREQVGLGRSGYSAQPIPWDRLASARTDDEGRFFLASREEPGSTLVPSLRLPPGAGAEHQLPFLIVEHPAHETTCSWLPTAAGTQDLGEIVMADGTVLLGRLVDARGAAIAGADVQVRGFTFAEDIPAQPLALPSRRFEQLTDELGRFRIPGLWRGGYVMFMQAPGASPDPHPIEVPEKGELDLGDLLVDAGERIAGRVVDEQDRPVAGARLRLTDGVEGKPSGPDAAALLWQKFPGDNGGPGSVEVSSGADGAFAFIPHSNSSGYAILAQAEGLDAAMLTGVAQGAVDLLLRLPPPATWMLRVVDAQTEQPLAEARLVGDRWAEDLKDEVGRMEVEAIGGAWRLRGASRLRTGVLASAPGHAPRLVMLPGLAAGETREEVLRLPRESVISGRVLDETGAPHVGARVRVGAPDDIAHLLDPRLLFADEQGRFRAAGLGAGSWELTAQASGAVRMADSRYVELLEGQELAVDLVLPRGGTITGILLDVGGQPMPGAPVWIETDTPEALAALVLAGQRAGPLPYEPSTASSAGLTGPDGRFVFPSLPPGSWIVLSTGGQSAIAHLLPGATVDVRLQAPQPSIVRGRVLAGQQAVADAAIELGLSGPDGIQWSEVSQSEDDGGFRFEQPLSGSGLVRATHAGSRSAPVAVELAAGKEQVVDLLLPTGRVTGRVVEAGSGAPLADIRVQLSQRPTGDSGLNLTTTSGADGLFALEGTGPGTWLVLAGSKEHCALRRPEVVVTEGVDPPALVLELVRAGAVEVQLESASSDESTFLVELELLTGGGRARGRGKPGEVVRVAPLPPGDFELHVRKYGDPAEVVLFRQRVTVVSGETLRVSASLGR